MSRSVENDAPTWGHWCYNQTPETLPATTPRCPQCGALNLQGARLANACKCGACYHPAIGPDIDGEPCDWCQDCGCHAEDHTRMTRVIPPAKSNGEATR